MKEKILKLLKGDLDDIRIAFTIMSEWETEDVKQFFRENINQKDTIPHKHLVEGVIGVCYRDNTMYIKVPNKFILYYSHGKIMLLDAVFYSSSAPYLNM